VHTENGTWPGHAIHLSSLPASFITLTRLEAMYMVNVLVTGGSLPPLWRLPRLWNIKLRVGAGVTGGLPDNWGKTTSLQALALGLAQGFTGAFGHLQSAAASSLLLAGWLAGSLAGWCASPTGWWTGCRHCTAM
jgi:hypothetical protein